MYSKPLLNKYIKECLKQRDWPMLKLAQELGIPHGNLLRSLNGDNFHLTLNQFSKVCDLLDFTPEQITHILTGKKKKEATLQLIKKSIDSALKAIN
jgi:DNA-binding Xre family transcriptional regulator